MPMYSYKCDRCKAEVAELRCLADREKLQACYRCRDGKMHQVIDGAPMALVRNPAVAPGKPWRKA